MSDELNDQQQDPYAAIMQQLKQQNDVLMGLVQNQQALAQRVNNPPPPVVQDPAPKPLEVSEEDFQTKPLDTLNRLIGHHLGTGLDQLKKDFNKQIAPLNQFQQQFTREQEYLRLKRQMMAVADYSDLSNFEDIFDQVMANQPVDPNAMIAAYNIAFARAIKTGRINTDGSSTQQTTTKTDGEGNTETKPNRIIPPHLAPARPRGNANATSNNQLRQLDSNEQRLAAERGWTQARWLFEDDEIDQATFEYWEAKQNPNFKKGT